MSERTQKLVALRSRTDHDLVVLVQRELDRAFALVDVGCATQKWRLPRFLFLLPLS